MADVTLTATTNADYCELNYPVRPYTSIYRFSADISKVEDNTYLFWDNGIEYDTPSCNCSFVVPYAQAMAFDVFIRAHRTENMTLTIGGTVPSGFYPFMPHRGYSGPFLVSCDVKKFAGFQDAPYKYFKIDLTFTFVYGGAWPSFSLPPEIAEGDVTIADITNIRYPEAHFDPAIDFSRFIIHDEQTTAYYDTHGSGADQAITDFGIRLNTSKAAALMSSLIIDYRYDPFFLTVGTWQYPFGEHYGDSSSFAVRLLQETIEVVHQENNMFETNLKLFNYTPPPK